jgi:hypothetical protein
MKEIVTQGESVMTNDDNERRLPPPIPDNFISNKCRNSQTRQQKPPKAPLRAITIKGNALRAAVRNGTRSTTRTFTKDSSTYGRKPGWPSGGPNIPKPVSSSGTRRRAGTC